MVLYAPTWRDYDRKNATVRLDLAKAREALGADHEFLVRAHAMQAAPHVPAGIAPRRHDISGYS